MRQPCGDTCVVFRLSKALGQATEPQRGFAIPKELEPYVNDYHVNLFEIAWLPDETIAKFQSDFRFVADYLSQKRKNSRHKSTEGEIRHVREVMELLTAVMQDTRFMDAYNKRIEEGRMVNMDAWIDEAEARGRKEGEQKSLVDSVRNLMKTMKLTKDKAMAALLVPPEKQKELQPLI